MTTTTAPLTEPVLDPELEEDLREATNAPPDLPRALPYEAFRNERLFELELAQLFRRDWVFACREQELAATGDYRAITVGGEPVVVVKTENGSLRAMANTCRHRGTLITEGHGNALRLECPYHAWTYSLEGRLIGTPYRGNVTIDTEANCLPAYRLECWGGLVFVTLDDTVEPLAERLSGLERLTARYEPSRYVPLFRRLGGDFEIEANWKLVYENAMESYHLFKVHPKTLNDVVPTRGFHCFAGSARWGASEGRKALWTEPTGHDPDTVGEHERTHRLVVMIPPSFMALYDHQFLSCYAVDPVSIDKTVIRANMFVPREMLDHDWSEFMSRVECFTREDIDIIARVKAGNRSRSRHLGHLVEMERIVGDFHNYLGSRLFRGPAPADPVGTRR